jgi:hypothetical protein
MLFIGNATPSIHPLGDTALGEPWPPQQPSSIALCLSSFIFITFKSATTYPSEADRWVSEQAIFYGVGLLAPSPTPNLEDQGIPFRLGYPP